MRDGHHHITIDPCKVAGWAAVVAVLLVLASVVTQLFSFATGHNSVYGLIPLFNLDAEQNIPTFFSALLLLLSSAATALIATLKHRNGLPYAWHWTGLALGFLYVATDEIASIHELAIRPMRELLGTYATGIFYFAWTIPGIALVIVLAVVYLRFWLRLPAYTRRLVLFAGGLYVGGAIGVELIGSRHVDLHGRDMTYSALAMTEEALEMGGTILFIFAMLDYIENHFGHVRLCFQK